MGWVSYLDNICDRYSSSVTVSVSDVAARRRTQPSDYLISRKQSTKSTRDVIRMQLAALYARIHPLQAPKSDVVRGKASGRPRQLKARKSAHKRTVRRKNNGDHKTRFLKSVARLAAITKPTADRTASHASTTLTLMARLSNIAEELAIKTKQDNWRQLSNEMDQLEIDLNTICKEELQGSNDHNLEQISTLSNRLDTIVKRGRSVLLYLENTAGNFLADTNVVRSQEETRRLSPLQRALDRQVTRLREGYWALENQVDALETRGAQLRTKFGRHAVWGTVKANADQTLGEVAEFIAPGICANIHPVYFLDRVLRRPNTYFSHFLGRKVELEPELIHPFLQTERITRYEVPASAQVVIIPYELAGTKQGRPITMRKLQSLRKTWAYFKECGDILASRVGGRMVDDGWYGFVNPKNLALVNSPKILAPDAAQSPRFAIDSKGTAAFVNGHAVALPAGLTKQLWYLLGLLNSSLLSAFLKDVSAQNRDGFCSLLPQFISKMPIKNPESDGDVKLANQISTAVRAIIKIKSKLQRTKLSDHELASLEGEVETHDRKIDELVLRLYDVDRVPT